ncbi:MAG: hypothetical protein HY540_02910 [Deltaproteobacteria bacterium]|nr:hypothetical protein [Deltaproteobacteria bacterium]
MELPKKSPKKFLPPFRPDQIWIDRSVEAHPQTLRLIAQLRASHIDFVDSADVVQRPEDISEAKRQVILSKHRGKSLRPLHPFDHHESLFELALAKGNPFDLSYCPFQCAPQTIPQMDVDFEHAFAELASCLHTNADRSTRIVIGESSDGLAFDPLLGYAALLIPFFAEKVNATLEIKTRSVFIDHLLELKHRSRTTFCWYLNPASLIASEERGTPSLELRLEAAEKALTAGYRVRFTIDPIIPIKGDDAEIGQYIDLISHLFAAIDAKHIQGISLATLRYPRGLPEIARKRFPGTRIFSGECVPDGHTLHPPKFVREPFLRPIWLKLRERLEAQQIVLLNENNDLREKLDALLPVFELNSTPAVSSPLRVESAPLFPAAPTSPPQATLSFSAVDA